MRRFLIAVIAICLLAAPPSVQQAAAQPVTLCGPRDGMGEMLAQRFAETPQAGGIVGDRLVELLVSPSGSWTILITGTDGRSCIVTGGENWTDQPIAAPKAVPQPEMKGTL